MLSTQLNIEFVTKTAIIFGLKPPVVPFEMPPPEVCMKLLGYPEILPNGNNGNNNYKIVNLPLEPYIKLLLLRTSPLKLDYKQF